MSDCFLELFQILVEPGNREIQSIDQVLALVTLQIDNTSASYRTAETVRLRDGPHCHVTAVTPTGDTQSCRIDRIPGDGGIHSGENVAQIAASKVFHIRAGKLFSLAITSAGIRQQDVVTV